MKVDVSVGVETPAGPPSIGVRIGLQMFAYGLVIGNMPVAVAGLAIAGTMVYIWLVVKYQVALPKPGGKPK
ncbi:hypothetical protein [Haladaptatus salinisoli]|uniref:hypothetical protein n=1 Tax=Haladaptatus salinisoli TaxID=2884876 RepID=UPI001D0A5D69|nr:hypothetical protein [Haladaptatus salinisoli]